MDADVATVVTFKELRRKNPFPRGFGQAILLVNLSIYLLARFEHNIIFEASLGYH